MRKRVVALLALLFQLLSFAAFASAQAESAQTNAAPAPASIQVLQRVPPTYPPVARQARIQGDVVLDAVIGADGSVNSVTVVSGHPLLVQSAVDAVKQWKYKPYVLDGRAVEVRTQIKVQFGLGGAPDSPPQQANAPTVVQNQNQPPPHGVDYGMDLAYAMDYCRTHPDNDIERLSGDGMCAKAQRAAAYCKRFPEGVAGFIACPEHAAALERKRAERAAFAKAQDEKIEAENKAKDVARDQKILWCEGQSLDAQIDPAALGLYANDYVGHSCGGLLNWVKRTQTAEVGQAFLRKAAQTDAVAKQRLEAWEAEQTRLKAEDLRLWKLHDATLPLLRVGQTQAEVKAILARQGFDPWSCDQLGDDVVNKRPGETIVGCLVTSRRANVFLLLFTVSQRYTKRDPDTAKITTWEVKTDRMTQIVDYGEHHKDTEQ